MLGLSAGAIRIKNKLTIPSKLFYDIRRPELLLDRKDEMESLFKELSTWENWNIYFFKDENEYNAVYGFSLNIVSKPSARDICICDDTMCTNYFGLPLIIALSIDENMRNQITGFGFLPGKTVEDFVKYFTFLKLNIQGSIRLFISDRSYCQNRGYSNAFPECDYIYCRRHISENISNNIGKIY